MLQSGQDLRPQAEQGTGLCLLQERFYNDVSPVTVSSWIKQNMILWYELSDQEALSLHQVKAMVLRPSSQE